MINGATGRTHAASPRPSRSARNLVHRFADVEKKPWFATSPTIPSLVPTQDKPLLTTYARLLHSGPNTRKAPQGAISRPSNAALPTIAEPHKQLAPCALA